MLALVTTALVLQAPATAVNVIGRAEMRVADVTTPLVRFAEVPENAAVVTHEDGLVTLRLASGSLLRLGPRTELVLARLEHGDPAGRRVERFTLRVGRLWAGVLRLLGTESRFEVETQNAVAGVRGTGFFVVVEGDTTRFTVDRGSVYVSLAGQEVSLAGPGASLAALGSGLGPPARLGEPALAALRASVGGPRAALGGGLPLAGLAPALLARGERERWRAELVGPNSMADTLAQGLAGLAPPATRTLVVVRARLAP